MEGVEFLILYCFGGGGVGYELSKVFMINGTKFVTVLFGRL